jgi:MFS family permease
MELVAHWRLSKQALIDLVFFCGVPIVLAMLSAVLGPYAAVMGAAGAAVYVLSLAIVPWWLTGLVTQWVSKTAGRSLPLWLIAAIGATAAGPFVYALLSATFSAAHIKSAALSEGRAIVLWIAFVVIFHETLGWARFAPPTREADREDRFQLSGAEWTAEDDALLRSLIGSGKPPRAIALEMKRTVGGIRARTAKLGLRNNRLSGVSAD